MDDELTIDLVSLVLILGMIGVAIWLLMKWLNSKNPFGAGGALKCAGANAVTGQLTQTQVKQQICCEAAAIVRASGGTISICQARTQAAADHFRDEFVAASLKPETRRTA